MKNHYLLARKNALALLSFNHVDITTYSLHPGEIQTNIIRTNGGVTDFIINILTKVLFRTTVEQGAINTLYPVLSPENKETGKYYDEGIQQEPNKIANDQEIVKKLWDVSEKMLKDHGMI